MSSILIVDSNTGYQQFINDKLGANHDIIIAGSGTEAIKIVGAQAVDLILLGDGLLDYSAQEVCEFIKGDHSLQDLPVVFVVDTVDPNITTRAYLCGGDDCISRKADLTELFIVVDIALQERTNIDDECITPLLPQKFCRPRI